MLERQRRVVLLIDYDNLQICAARDTPGRDLQLPPVVQLAQRYGTVIMARAYAEWNLSTERLGVYKAGIEPAFAPVLRTESDRSGKSLADTVMVAEGMDMLWTLSPDVVVLATSDKDLIPLVRVAKQRGAFVVVLGSDFTAIPLREMADEHFTYRQLITEPSGRFTPEPGSGRQPAALPEPSRRRPRERNGRERTPITSSPSVAAAPPARAERPEREVAPAAPAAAASPASAEPVAPVTGGLAAADTDSQIGGRRRRRRGSRRRSDRTGQVGEGTYSSEGGYSEGGAPEGGFDDEGPDEAPHDVLEVTPTSSAIEVAEASSGTVEAEARPAAEPAAPEAVEAAGVVEGSDVVEAPAAPAPRDRRRRTRRPVVVIDTESESVPEPEAEAAVPEVEEPVILPLAEPEQSADVPPAAEPPTTNGEAAPAPRTRPRRVASAARGRTRRG